MWTSLLLFLLTSLPLPAQVCGPTKIRRQTEPQKYHEVVVKLCDAQNGVHFASPDCQKIESCVPKKELWKLRAIRSQIESPGFAVCEMSGGKAHFIEIWRKSEWYQTDVCFFGPERFIDNDRLYQIYKSTKP